MIEIAKHRTALDSLGLTTLDSVKAHTGKSLKTHGGKRDVFRIEIRGAVLFLNSNWSPHKKDGIGSLLRYGSVWSIAKQEWENSFTVSRAGLHTAALVAYRQDCGPVWERFSFIITEAAPGKPLSECLNRRHDALNITAPVRSVSAKERVRFRNVYGGRQLLTQIEKRVRCLLRKRRKFAGFSA